MNFTPLKNGIKRFFKYTGYGLAGLVFLVFFVFVCLRLEFVENKIKDFALERANLVLADYGLQVSAEHLDINLPFSLRVRNVLLRDEKNEIASLASLSVNSRFLALLRYRVVIPSIEVNHLALLNVPQINIPEKPEETEEPVPFKEQFEQIHTLLFGKYMPSVLVSNIEFKNLEIAPSVINTLKNKDKSLNNGVFDSPVTVNSSWSAGLEKEILRISGNVSVSNKEKQAELKSSFDLLNDKNMRFSADFSDENGLLIFLAKEIGGAEQSQKASARFSLQAVGTLQKFEIKTDAAVFDDKFLQDTAVFSAFYNSKPFKGNLRLNVKPVVPGMLNKGEIAASVDLDTFSITDTGEKAEDKVIVTQDGETKTVSADTPLDEAIAMQGEIPNKNIGFSYDIRFSGMDYAQFMLQELLGTKQSMAGKIDVQFFTRQLPRIMVKDLDFSAKNISCKTDMDISRTVNVNSEFSLKSFSFLDTDTQTAKGKMSGKLSVSGNLENPRLTLRAEIPQFLARAYNTAADKKDNVNAREYNLENLRLDLKSEGFEKAEEVIPLDVEALKALYKKHPYAAAIKRMQELHQSAVNYPVKFRFDFKADYMGEHNFVRSDIRMSPRLVGLGQHKEKFIEFNKLESLLFGADFRGKLRFDFPEAIEEDLKITGKIQGNMADAKALENAFLLPLTLKDLTYSFDFKNSQKKGQQADISLRAAEGAYSLNGWKDFRASFSVSDLWKNGNMDNTVSFSEIELTDIGTVKNWQLSLKGMYSKMLLHTSFAGDADFDAKLSLSTNFEQLSGRFLSFDFRYPYKKTKISLQKKADFFLSAESVNVKNLRFSVAPKGETYLEGQMNQNKINVYGWMKDVNLAFLPKDFKGILDGRVKIGGSSANPNGTLEMRLRNFQTLSSPPMSFVAIGKIVESKGLHSADFELKMVDKEKYQVEDAFVSFRIPLTYSPLLTVSKTRPISGDIVYKGSLKTLWGYVPLEGRKLEGNLELKGKISGTLSRPSLTVSAQTEKARYEDLILGIMLSNLSMKTSLEKGHGEIKLSAGDGRKGTVTLTGTFDIPFLYHGKYVPELGEQKNNNILQRKIRQAKRSLAVLNLETSLVSFNPFYRNDFTATLSGSVGIKEMVENIRIEGDITVEKGEVHLENIRTSSIPKLNIVEDSSKRIRRNKAASRGNLDIGIHIPNNFGVYAPGIEILWKGELQVLGKLQNPAVKGTLSAYKGKMNIIGSELDLNKGEITFDGSVPIVPALDLKLEHNGNGVQSFIILKGLAYRPELEMTSNPYLPSDEVLAHILFSRSVSELSDFEKIRLATVLTSLVGFDISSGITGTTKNIFGLDVLSIDSRQSADGEEEINVEIGKYIKNNVYIGIEQGVDSPDTAGVLKYEINENLSVGTKAGTEESEVGFKWKFDY